MVPIGAFREPILETADANSSRTWVNFQPKCFARVHEEVLLTIAVTTLWSQHRRGHTIRDVNRVLFGNGESSRLSHRNAIKLIINAAATNSTSMLERAMEFCLLELYPTSILTFSKTP